MSTIIPESREALVMSVSESGLKASKAMAESNCLHSIIDDTVTGPVKSSSATHLVWNMIHNK